jgi:hypothetical protein
MRKDLLALGIFLCFVGLGFMAASQIVIKPEPREAGWIPVKEITSEQPSYLLSVQGPLNQRDKFRVYFGLGPAPGLISMDASVEVNFTDPNGYTALYDIPVGRGSQGGPLAVKSAFPEGVVNYTGTYKVDAEAIWGISLTYLALQKMKLEEKEPQYPYSTFFPVGIATFLAGGGISFLGVKISKQKRRFHKHKVRLFVQKYLVLEGILE